MKTISLALLVLGLALGGCNTVDGMGKDLRALSNKLDGKAPAEKKN